MAVSWHPNRRSHGQTVRVGRSASQHKQGTAVQNITFILNQPRELFLSFTLHKTYQFSSGSSVGFDKVLLLNSFFRMSIYLLK